MIMSQVLDQAIKELPNLFRSAPQWPNYFLDYYAPPVERIFIPYENSTFICLHKIYPSKTALFHPHAWPCAVQICDGGYEMEIGYGDPKGPRPNVAMKFTLPAGARYSMVDPNCWHSVRPIDKPSYSVCVVGPKWGTIPDEPTQATIPLTDEQYEDMLQVFENHPIINPYAQSI